ncbi:Hpt domain-containing protein [Butyrivibrio sp. AE3004]|uniref:Hpt domain-containing protein n=1 Tax=Butyrivibrio sp. AE3004 TaxID=1506994 RepID=UPI00049475C2|nr:hypothetical protein [Butyrivibrio sp. AE3004]
MNDNKIEALNNWGADASSAVKRMLGDTDFYLNLIDMFLTNNDWEELSRLISEKKYKEAFVVSHRMKGSCADLSLTPLYNALCEVTDDLRNDVRPSLSYNYERAEKLHSSLKEAIK